MTSLILKNVGKRFNRNWIFRHVNYQFETGRSYAITGANGSGKSTLLQVLAGAMQHSEGKIEVRMSSGTNPTKATPVLPLLPSEHLYQHIALAAPYLELIEELTLREFLVFHFRFKPLTTSWDILSIIKYIGLTEAAEKQIRNFSSGMKQRVKLAQAFFAATPILLLDEPCTNLDVKGIELYHRLVKDFSGERLLIVCSNDENEISFCTERLNIMDYQ